LGLSLYVVLWGGLNAGCNTLGEESFEGQALQGSVESELQAATLFSTQHAIAAGHYHSLLLRSDGTVSSWGMNTSGQLGDGTTTHRPTAVQLTLPPIKAIAAGANHSLAVDKDGKVRAWGQNTYGQLGNGSTTSSPVLVPVTVTIPGGAKAVAGGLSHSLALGLDGKVWTWGLNTNGQLGNNSTTSSSVPVAVNIPGGAIAIAAGWYHSLALSADGKVWAWGRNNAGQVGNGGMLDQKLPVSLNLVGAATAIAAGGLHSLALGADGKVWTWGSNSFGQLGNGNTQNQLAPVQHSTLSNLIFIAAGGYFSLAVSAPGQAWTWGQNNRGQLGNGSLSNSTTPVPLSGVTDALALAGGYLHTLALRPGCPLWAWGYNTSGQLGDGTTADRLTPTQAQILNTFYWDADMDGYGDPDPGMVTQGCWPDTGYVENKQDCDDFDSFINPDAPELCNGVDDDCSGTADEGNPQGGGQCSTGNAGVCEAGTLACSGGTLLCVQQTQPSSETCDALDNDCDGTSDDGNPGGTQPCSTGLLGVCGQGVTNCCDGAIECVQMYAPSSEVCDGKDNDCDGLTDEGVASTTWYKDGDGDTYGNPSVSLQACSAPAGYVSNSGDCNDGNASIKPGATEVCDWKDNDCDGMVDEGVPMPTWYRDADGDGYGTPNSTLSSCFTQPGYISQSGDCNDSNASIKPGATEVCNNVDDNCSGTIDEGLTKYTLYRDVDGDGWGTTSQAIQACSWASGYSFDVGDCNDSNANIHPERIEVCGNGVDDNCNGTSNEGCGGGGSCFVAGTPITLADGSTKPIEQLVIGDRVLAYDEETQQVVPSSVTQTFIHEDSDNILLINGTLRATANHPFYANGRWVRADELRVGDALVRLETTGSSPSVSNDSVTVFSLLSLPQRQTTYNIEVDTQHNYFADGILVHNKIPPYDPSPAPVLRTATPERPGPVPLTPRPSPSGQGERI
jgi:alpha-tubulin suppressor-like RCC1 family protein